jgi:hypothetical protein
VETAQDIPYDPATPDKFTQARNDLDQKRSEAVQKYLRAYAGSRGLAFQVLIHDPNEVGISAAPAGQSILRSNAGAVGVLPLGSGAGGGSVSGGAGASAGVGGPGASGGGAR